MSTDPSGLLSFGFTEIDHVGFSFTDDQQNEARSYARVTSADLLGPDGPKPNGIYDLHMGTTDDRYRCATCHLGKRSCQGHPGVIDAKVSMINPLALPEVKRWLKVTCFECGTCVVPKEKYARLHVSRRLAAAAVAVTAAAEFACPVCGVLHPWLTQNKEDTYMFRVEVGVRGARGPARGRTTRELYPGVVLDILQRVPAQQVQELGRDPRTQHPSRLIVRQLPVTPVNTRPLTRAAGGGFNHSDISNLLHHIAKRNLELLPEQLPAALTQWAARDQPVSAELDRTVRNQLLLYFSTVKGTSEGGAHNALHTGNRPVKSLTGGLAGKEGRIRGNITGKRVVFIARTTISGDTQIAVDEVGIPASLARTLQVEETFQPYCRQRLLVALANGTGRYPGATLLRKQQDDRWYAVGALGRYVPQDGDRLLRDLVDDDLVYINRQPTLERCGIGVHKARIMHTGDTMRLNVLACAQYNADFDGDQMNVWAARGPAARAEAAIMSPISNWFLSTKGGEPVNGQAQDSLVGSYLLTRERTVLGRAQAMQAFSGTREHFEADPPQSGRALVSLLIPPGVNLVRRPSSFPRVYESVLPTVPDETEARVVDGVVQAGVLDKSTVGEGAAGGLNHLVALMHGARRALGMIFNMQQLAIELATMHGFTCSMSDLFVRAECRQRVDLLVSKVILEAAALADRLVRGEVVAPIGMTVAKFYEQLAISTLRIPDTELFGILLGNGEVCYRGALDPERPVPAGDSARPTNRYYPGCSNGFLVMGLTGAKGSPPHIAHIMGAVGQVTVDGERPPESADMRRTMPYYPRYDLSCTAHGFVPNSYIGGLTLTDFLHAASAGRVDLIRKALSTADTGALTRRGVMSMQSLFVNNHRQVIMGRGLLQPLYGDDGCDPRRLQRVSVRALYMSDAEVLAHVGGAEHAARADLLRQERDWLRAQLYHLEAAASEARPAPGGSPQLAELRLPFDAEAAARKTLAHLGPDPAPAPLAGLHLQLDAFCARLPYAYLNRACEARQSAVPRQFVLAARLPQLALWSALGADVLQQLGAARLAAVLDEVWLGYQLALVDYGSAAGINAVHSVSERLTQYMLDSHHRSTEGGTTVAGLTRVSEIFMAMAPEKEQSAAMRLVLKPAVASLEAARAVATQLEYLTLNDFVVRWDVCYEAHNHLVVQQFASDSQWVAEYRATHVLIPVPTDVTRWCLRVEVSRTILVVKAITLEAIVAAVRAQQTHGWIAHTRESARTIVLRVWFGARAFGKKAELPTVEPLARATLAAPVRGVPGVQQAKARLESRHAAGPDGRLARAPEYVVQTVGSNLQGALRHTLVDAARSTTNSIGETYATLGVLAASSRIASEVTGFMGSGAPNPRHLQLYAQLMTRSGAVTSLERHGLRDREADNVLLNMTAGSPVQTVANAASRGAAQPIYGCAAASLVGATPKTGTMFNRVVMDEQFVVANTRNLEQVLDDL